MPSIKYNLKGVESGGPPKVPVGVHKFKITEAKVEKPEGKDRRLVLHLQPQGKHRKCGVVREYVNLELESTRWKLRQVLEAVGIVTDRKESGSFDPDDLVGEIVTCSIKEDTYQGEYQPRIGNWMKPTGDVEEPEPDEDEDEDEDEDDEEDGEVDYSELDDDDLIAELEMNDLEAPMKGRGRAKKLDRAKAIEMLEEVAEEDSEEEPEDEDDSDAEDYNEWELDELKDELKERGLSTRGKKATLVSRLEADDAEEGEGI